MPIIATQAEKRLSVYSRADQGLVEISKAFEDYLLKAPAGLKSKIAIFISTIVQFNFFGGFDKQNDLRTRWANDEYEDLTTELDGYASLLGDYDALRNELTDSISGFEDVPELSTLVSDLNILIGSYSEKRDSLVFSKALANLSRNTEFSALSEGLQTEIESYASVLVAYT